jgi:hypothetical protein
MSLSDWVMLAGWLTVLVYFGSPKLQDNALQNALVDRARLARREAVSVPVRHEKTRDKRTV